jgi:hypothetical protein
VAAMPSFEHYTFGDADAVGMRSISLLTAPFAIQPFGTRAISLQISGAWASGTVERSDGTVTTLSGPTDMEVRLSVSPKRFITVTSALLLPTGREKQTAEEADVAGIVAADLLPFRISNWGSGGGADVSASLTAPAGPLVIGVRAGYQVAREFEPLEGRTFAYRPGNQLYVRGAFDYNAGRTGKLSAHLTVQRFDNDQIDGQNLYRSGNRTQFIGSYAFAASRRTSAVVYAGAMHRDRAVVLTEEMQRPTQNLILAGGGVRLRAGGAVLTPSVDARVFRSEGGVGQGYLAGAGSAVEFRLGGGTTIAPSARVRIGTVESGAGGSSGITGVEGGLAVRFGGARR